MPRPSFMPTQSIHGPAAPAGHMTLGEADGREVMTALRPFVSHSWRPLSHVGKNSGGEPLAMSSKHAQAVARGRAHGKKPGGRSLWVGTVNGHPPSETCKTRPRNVRAVHGPCPHPQRRGVPHRGETQCAWAEPTPHSSVWGTLKRVRHNGRGRLKRGASSPEDMADSATPQRKLIGPVQAQLRVSQKQVGAWGNLPGLHRRRRHEAPTR